MATNDIRSDLQPILANLAAHAGDGTVDGVSIDTAAFELGLMFTMAIAAFTTGDFDVVLEQSDTGAFAGEEEVIPTENLIGTLAAMQLVAVSANGDVLPTIGVFGNKRFVRINSVGSDTSVGTVVITAVQKGENLPVI